ncbi:queuosine precursor transporter [Beggiatoa leptomitoformis]|uniref:Probable queuosine precursor transporter n=1 Tax=Beggiatoa leptomitoformis TaxID=288004 RepID=A0A650GCS9_9GAMM|nr:queuosine precursor transporter [Beggiatoa leptomitoformis]QGX03548.1 queuosine precursor transporter [Beggiatoa leptomitoformis]QGX04050.1 queuosine precursor transporter [Beggiatoa leptomitoformis]
MLPDPIVAFFWQHAEILWLLTVIFDLSTTILMYRWFGKAGLYGVVVMSVMLSNLQGPKLITVFGMQTSVGVILYSGIYFATDILSEKYGSREGQRAVMIGFVASIMMVFMIYISLLYEPANVPFAKATHEAILTLFNFTPLFVFGSLFVYLVSQSFDVWVYHKLMHWTQGRHLWLRNNVSTIASQTLDTALYAVIVWAPIVGMSEAIELAIAKYILKVVVALMDTPFIYWAASWDMRHRDWSETRHGKVYNYEEIEGIPALPVVTTTPTKKITEETIP